MKYRDENGDFQDLYLPPTGDTLPIGSEVDYEGETVPYGWEQVDNPEEYSTDEVKTNKVWIDGKPIYRKTFTTTNLPGNATTTLGSISNLDTVIDINGIIPLEPDASTKQYITLNHIRNSSLNWAIAPVITNDNVQIMRGSFGTVSGTVHVTVEYTKTTD